MINVEIQKNGALAPCCRYSAVKEDWHFRRFKQWWQEDLKELREALWSGQQHPGCKNCWRDESLGIRSYRQTINSQVRQYKNLSLPLELPKTQMYNFGTHCNLRCIMCSPYASSSLATEYLQNKTAFHDIDIRFQPTDNELKWYRKDEFVNLQQSLLESAANLAFQGGEPLLSPEVLAMLEKHPAPDTVSISITTNLTTLTDHMLDLLGRFQWVNLIVSLEGVGAHNDYLRYGSDWGVLQHNIQRVLDRGLNLRVSHTFQRTSLYALPALIEFACTLGISVVSNILDSPPYLAIHTSTMAERESFFAAIDRLPKIDDNLLSLKDFVIRSGYNQVLDQKFWSYIAVLDRIRGTDFRSVFVVPDTINDDHDRLA